MWLSAWAMRARLRLRAVHLLLVLRSGRPLLRRVASVLPGGRETQLRHGPTRGSRERREAFSRPPHGSPYRRLVHCPPALRASQSAKHTSQIHGPGRQESLCGGPAERVDDALCAPEARGEVCAQSFRGCAGSRCECSGKRSRSSLGAVHLRLVLRSEGPLLRRVASAIWDSCFVAKGRYFAE